MMYTVFETHIPIWVPGLIVMNPDVLRCAYMTMLSSGEISLLPSPAEQNGRKLL